MENPFPDLKIDDWSFMESTSERTECKKCKKLRKYYCYSCFIPLPVNESKLPRVKLPIYVDIIKHPNEQDGKSTSSHAAILAPEDVTIHIFPCIPDYDADKVLLVFPSEHSSSLEDIAAKFLLPKNQEEETNNELGQADKDRNICDESNSSTLDKRTTTDKSACSKPSAIKKAKEQINVPYNRVVFIDSTWNQTKNIVNDERLKNLKTVELHSRNTLFWRHQDGKPDTYLATIEAIYYFIRDYHHTFISDYQNEYDNLLFFFSLQYSKIAQAKRAIGYQDKPKKSKKAKIKN